MTAAKIRPTPIPGPIAPRPYPMAARPGLMLTACSAAWARTMLLTCISLHFGPRARADRGLVFSVLRRQRGADVPGRQQGEDVGLQHLDEGFEERHQDRENERHRRNELQPEPGGLGQQEAATEGEHHDEEVTGEHRG